MALRNQPYLPLYVNDVLSDEKLKQVSAEAHGFYFLLLCILHKSEPYGCILLNQMQKQNDDMIVNFASTLTKQMPFDFPIVKKSLVELIAYNILSVESDMLVQKRMVKDFEISEKRAKAGRSGGEQSQRSRFAQANIEANLKPPDFAQANDGFAQAIAKAKFKANSEIEIETVFEGGTVETFGKPDGGTLIPEMLYKYKEFFKGYPPDVGKDYPALLEIAYRISETKHIAKADMFENREVILTSWVRICEFVSSDKWFKTRSISDLNNEWQRLVLSMSQTKQPVKQIVV